MSKRINVPVFENLILLHTAKQTRPNENISAARLSSDDALSSVRSSGASHLMAPTASAFVIVKDTDRSPITVRPKSARQGRPSFEMKILDCDMISATELPYNCTKSIHRGGHRGPSLGYVDTLILVLPQESASAISHCPCYIVQHVPGGTGASVDHNNLSACTA
jgi:hypothetical protein